MIRIHRIAFALLIVSATTGAVSAQRLTAPPAGDNQRSIVTQYLGMVSVTIDYNSPDVTSPAGDDRTGKIWGELVPWGIAPNPFYPGFGSAETMPWRVGANENTTIEFSHDVEIEEQPLPAGKYALFMVPGPETWQVIFNRNNSAWGSFFYDPGLDQLRVRVIPEKTDHFREWLTFEFDDRQLDSATAVLHWEHLRVPFRVRVPNMSQLYRDTMAQELTGAVGFNFQNFVQASQWAAGQEAYHQDALDWADAAIAANPTFQTMANKANVLSRIGRTDEALTTFDQAMEQPTATAVAVHMVARGLQGQGQMEAANVIFRKNHEKNGGQWPVDFGMARVYAHEGNFEKALEHAMIAKGRAPAGPQLQNLEAQIARLEKGENINP